VSATYKPKPEDILNFIERMRAFNVEYHNQKDKMAYAVAGLIVAFGAAFFVGNQPPRSVLSNLVAFSIYLIALIVLWSVAHFVLCFQLKNKRIAAIRVAALTAAAEEVYFGQHTSHPELFLDFSHAEITILRDVSPSPNTRRYNKLFDSVRDIFDTMSLRARSTHLADLPFTSGPKFLTDAYKRALLRGTYSAQIEWAAWIASVLALLIMVGKSLLLFFMPVC
jgi:hypothetical protein